MNNITEGEQGVYYFIDQLKELAAPYVPYILVVLAILAIAAIILTKKK